MKIAVIMNASSGTGGEEANEREQQIRTAFEAAGVTPEIHHVKPEKLPTCVEELAAKADVVVAAGGDGTVSAVAGSMAGNERPLGVLPLGTLNHFSRDIGIPQDLKEAAAVIVAGHTKRIDVAELNGRVFVNNSSIGLYPQAVLHREREQKRSGRGKWTAMLIASFRVLRRFKRVRATVHFPDRSTACATPLIFIGNNEYKINVLELGEREQIDRGALGVYMIRSKGRLSMIWLVVRAILGRIEAVRDFDVVSTPEVSIDIKDKHLQVALDGEVVPMKSPLKYRTRPGALNVIIPEVKSA